MPKDRTVGGAGAAWQRARRCKSQQALELGQAGVVDLRKRLDELLDRAPHLSGITQRKGVLCDIEGRFVKVDHRQSLRDHQHARELTLRECGIPEQTEPQILLEGSLVL